MRSYPDLSEDELRAALGAYAAGHLPDRTAMLDRLAGHRVTHRIGGPVHTRPPAGQAMRLAGSALGVATILGVGGVARWALADGPAPAGVSGAPPAATSARPPTTPAGPALPATTPAVGIEQGPLWSDGSVDGDAGRSVITLKVREPLTALNLTVRLALTPGLTDRGAHYDAGGAGIDAGVVREKDAVVYHFVLADGETLGAGTYEFVATYARRDGGRDAGGDSYRATATTGDGTPLEVGGDFYPTN